MNPRLKNFLTWVGGIVIGGLLVWLLVGSGYAAGKRSQSGSSYTASGDGFERHNDDVRGRAFDQYGNRR